MTYTAGRSWDGQQVAIVAGLVQLSSPDGKVIRVHPIRPRPDAEMGAFAVPHGRPVRRDAAVSQQPTTGIKTYRTATVR